MSSEQSYNSLQALVGELASLCKEGASGTVFIATDDNRLVRMTLDGGEIRFISFQNKRGAAALNLMPQIKQGRLRFEEGVISGTPSADLPPTADTLRFLANPASSAAPSSPAATAATNRGSSAITDKDRAVIETVLADYIGPMASIVCDEHLSGAQDLQTALKKLAAEIQDPLQAEKFIADVNAQRG